MAKGVFFIGFDEENGEWNHIGNVEDGEIQEDTDGELKYLLQNEPLDESYLQWKFDNVYISAFVYGENIDKQNEGIPYEHREYVDSPDDVPEGAQVREGTREDVWFYDTREVDRNEGSGGSSELEEQAREEYQSIPKREITEDVESMVDNVMDRQIERCKQPEILYSAFESLDYIEDKTESTSSMRWTEEEVLLKFKEDLSERTVGHETGHIIMNGNGFDTNKYTNSVSFIWNIVPTNFPPIDWSLNGEEWVEMIRNDEETREHLLMLTDEEYLEKFDDLMDSLAVKLEDWEFEKEDFMLSKENMDTEGYEDVETTEEVENLVDKVNETWEHIVEAAEEEDSEEFDKRKIRVGYEATSAHEMWATLHEMMQTTTNTTPAHVQGIVSKYPDLADAYRQVFEPHDEVKEWITGIEGRRDE